MKVKSSALFGLMVVICSISGFSLLKRFTQEVDEWRPSNLYSSTNLTRRSTFSVVSSAPASSSEAVATISSGSESLFGHGGAVLYAPASTPTHSLSPLASSPSGGLYTTSSAELRSFGGGGNGGGVSMSGGSVKSSGPSMASAGLGVSMPSTSVFAYNAKRNNSTANDVMSSVSGDIAMASSYAGISNTTGGRRISGRRNAGPEDQWLGWLGSDMWGYGGGSSQITEDDLFKLWFKGMTGEEYDPSNPAHIDFMNSSMWDSFLAWFNSKQTDKDFGWYWVPISDAVPFVLLLCLMYAFVIYRKTKQAKKTNAEN